MKNILLMKRWRCKAIILLIFFHPLFAYTQDTASSTLLLPQQSDTSSHLDSEPIVKTTEPFIKDEYRKRKQLVTTANIVGYPVTMVSLYYAWYKQYPQTHFHFFNDNNEWKQVDKAGHAYSAYIESYASMECWRWAGVSRNQRIWIGGLSGAIYQTVIETLDGFSAGWGWSWGDIGANTFGSGMLIGQELAWNEQRIKFKFSFHKKNYGDAVLNQRADDLYGKSLPQRMIKDYNGQTYWLSVNLKSFMPETNLPRWLNIAVGYGADGMFGAVNNLDVDDHGNTTFNRMDITRYRQYYISPDIDFTRIRTNNKFVRLAFNALNVLKFPFPSLEYNSKGKFAFHLLHF